MSRIAVPMLVIVLSASVAGAQTQQDFEPGQGDWYADNGVWEVGTPTAGPGGCHGGARCAGTVLHGNYPFTASRFVSPVIQLDSGTVQNPVVLRFWHWFAWGGATGGAPGRGVVQIAVYDPGPATWSAWTNVGNLYSGSSTVWTQVLVDLTTYSGRLVRIGFQHQGANAFSTGAGWFLDDLQVDGTFLYTGVFTTLQDFEAGQGNWFADNGVWEVGLPTGGPARCHAGSQCAGTVLNGNYPFTNSRFISPPVQLGSGTFQNPLLLRFWHWFAWGGATGGAPGRGVVQIAVYDETTAAWSSWADVTTFFSSASAVWTLNVVDLTPFSGRLARIGFFHQGANAFSTAAGWYLDDIALGVGGPAGDSDADGLPDDWETQYGLNPGSATGNDGATGDPDADGATNLDEYQHGTHPRGFFKKYLAEGAINAFFDVRLALLNVGTSDARILLRFLQPGGATLAKFELLAPLRRRTLTRTDFAGLASPDFSTVLESDQLVMLDRTMSWNASGYGSHAESGVGSPATTWYLAEGSTSGDFELFYLLQNPNATATVATVRYLRPFGLPPIERVHMLAPNSRTTIPVDAQGPDLASTDVSAVITAALPIIVERAMYLTRLGEIFAAGHGSAGVTAAATHWFLAEGATGPFFDLFILLANPGDQTAEVRVDYLLTSGTTYSKSYSVPANGRSTIWVDDEQIPGGSGIKPLENVAVSSTIASTNGVPIIVERAMWWPGPALTPAFWLEAHNSPGTTTTAARWALAEGEVGGPHAAETYILIANVSAAAGEARVRLHFEDGTAAERTFGLAPRSRTNVTVSGEFPAAAGRRFGATIESLGAVPAQIVVERAMYTSPNGVTWAAGTNATATPIP